MKTTALFDTSRKTTTSDSSPAVANLATEYLKAWAQGANPASETFLNQLATEDERDQFKQSVAMGKILKQVLS
jgi:hypothetical protein